MATGNGGNYNWRTDAFDPVSEMLDCGRCEPLKAVVHGVVLAAVAVCGPTTPSVDHSAATPPVAGSRHRDAA